jgi:hypothetical protein
LALSEGVSSNADANHTLRLNPGTVRGDPERFWGEVYSLKALDVPLPLHFLMVMIE